MSRPLVTKTIPRYRCEATTVKGKQCKRDACHTAPTPIGTDPPKLFLCEQHWRIYMEEPVAT